MRNPNATYHEIDQEWTQPSTNTVYGRTITIAVSHNSHYGADLDGNRGIERTEWEVECVWPWTTSFGPKQGQPLNLETFTEADLDAFEASGVENVEKAVENFLSEL